MPSHQHYDHIGAFYHPGLGETFTTSTVTFMDVRAGTSVISRGAKSDAVAQLQALLNALKFRDSKGRALIVDKLFGPNTEFSLRAAQNAIKIKNPLVTPTGALDKPTLAALEAMQVGEPVTPPPAPIPLVPAPIAPPPTPWWKSPWVLGGGAVALVGAVFVLLGDDEKKKA